MVHRRRGRSAGRYLILAMAFAIGLALPLLGQGSTGPAIPPVTPAPTAAEIPLLEPGKPIRRTLAGGGSHPYRILLEAGQFAQIVVEQQGLDVVAILTAPNGTKIAESDSPNVSFGPEILWVVAETSGEYRLQVNPAEPKASPANYEARIVELRSATARDRKRFEAQRVSAEAETLRNQQKAESIQTSLDLYRRAAQLWREAEDPAGLARTLFSFATAQGFAGNLKDQLALFQETLALQPDLADRGFEATALTWVAIAYNQLGEREQALSYFDRAIAIQQELGDRPSQSVSLHSRGQALAFLGENQKAFASFLEALAISRELGDKHGEGVCLGDLGFLYEEVGELDKALDSYSQALAVHKAAGNRRSEAIMYNNIGLVYASKEDWPKALEYHERALPLRRESGDRRGESYTLNNLAVTHSKLGKLETALDEFGQALELRRSIGDRYGEGTTHYGLGELHLAAGRPAPALDEFERALALRRDVADLHGQAEALAGIARALREQGKLAIARDKAEEAVSLVESVRSRVSSSQRATYLGESRKYYELQIDLTMQLHRQSPGRGLDAQALEISERARARSLVELLTEARANIHEGVDTLLVGHEKWLRRELGTKISERTRLLGGKHTEEQAAEASKGIDDLVSQLQEIEAQIRALNPRYAALIQPEPLQTRQIQEALDENTFLLEYALGSDRSYVWLVGRESLSAHELPGRARIEDVARKVYQELSRSPQASVLRSDRIRELSEMVLGPLKGAERVRRLVVVADGALQLVPFSALPAPGGSNHLLADREIVSLPSASVLALLRQGNRDRKPPTKTLALFADPVFDRNDQRVRGARAERPAEPASVEMGLVAVETPLTRSARDMGLAGSALPRLPFTRREATAIQSLVAPSQRRVALDFAATRAAVTDGDLSGFRYAHFATHGFLDAVHPELSGLVLSLVDRKGQDQEGFLPAMEIFNLKLSAELVVLSACQTALGKEIRGEGLVGLTRAFMYAGTPRVVASLWRVDDAATAELMKRFYEGMLGAKKLRPAAALREAQLAVSGQKRWAHPYYWAGFVLQGEWR
jgi:CHAT domain-containing protein